MAKYEIITPRPGTNASYSLTGSLLVGGPPPVGTYTGNSDGSLCGWWRLNEDVSSTGNVTDSSGNGRSGTFAAATNRPAYSSLTPGVIQSNTNYFDHSLKQTFNVGTADTWDKLVGAQGTSNISISAWVYRTSGAYGAIIEAGDYWPIGAPPRGYFKIYISGADPAGIQVETNWSIDNGYWQVLGVIPTNNWTHVTVTYDATSVSNVPRIYINGTAQSIDTISTPEGTWNGILDSDVRIGGPDPALASYKAWPGNLADVAIWNSILTDTDIAAIHAAATGPNYYTYRNFDLIGYGERLSPSGSQYQMSLQGIDTQPDDIYFPSLLPRIRQGAPMSLWRQGEKISDKYFDDTLSIPHSGSTSLRGANDVKISMRVNFEWEQLNFGQAPTVQQGESYVETNPFNAVGFITSPESTYWPVNLFNIGSLLDHEFDGTIEPLDIRSELLGLVRSRFEGHSVRGALQGASSETYFGSKQIVDKWRSDDEKISFFLDAPINWNELTPSPSAAWSSLPVAVYSNITAEPASPFVDHDAFEQTVSTLIMNNPQLPGGVIPYDLALNPGGFSVGSQLPLPMGRNCIVWWRLKDDVSTSGLVGDYSGNGRAGSFTSNDQRPGYATETPAEYIQSHVAAFNGPTSAIEIGDDSVWESLVGGSGASALSFSISTWVYVRSLGNGNTGGRIIDFGGQRILKVATHSGGMQIQFYVGVAGGTSTAQNLDFDKWYHVAATYDGGSVNRARLYIDGTQQDLKTPTSPTAVTFDSVIGNRYSGGWAFDGYIADISVWNYRLPVFEVEALYNATKGISRYDLKDDMLIAAMRQMNTGSYPTVDHTERRANHGFYFGQNAGSIVYGDE